MGQDSQNLLADTLQRICSRAVECEVVDFLLIGGNAVIAYGVPRFTRDIDFVIPEDALPTWRDLLEMENYRCFQATHAFAQFEDVSAIAPRVDLMIVDQSTWEKLLGEAREAEYGRGIPLKVAAVEHLIAMKLRAVKSPQRRFDAVDWQDIIELSYREGLDPGKHEQFRNLVLDFGSEDLLEKLIDEIEIRRKSPQ
ncbi:MAG: nucleotidyltransferase [Verrucomicrobiota bacterium]